MKQTSFKFLVLFLLLFTLGLNTAEPINRNLSDINNKLTPKVLLTHTIVYPSVRIIASSPVIGEVTGSGTIINEKYILTAYHVIEDATDIYIEVPPEMNKIKCEVEAFGNSEELDYAILRATRFIRSPFINTEVEQKEISFKYHAILINEEEFKTLFTGEELKVAGYPLGDPFHLSMGYLGCEQGGFFRTSVPIIYGNSGGGCFDHLNRLIGVVVRIRLLSYDVPVYHLSYIVPMNKIYEDIKNKNQEYIWKGITKPDGIELREYEEENSNSLNEILKHTILIKDLKELLEK